MNTTSPHNAPQPVNMVLGQLYTNKILDVNLLQALANTPREDFVPAALRGAAYVDEDLEIGDNSYLLAPLTFAQLLQLAEITPSCRVLVVGDESGYAAAVIKKLTNNVVTDGAPYDVIFINGGVEVIPEVLTSQLAIGGRLVAVHQLSAHLGKGIVVKRLDGQVNTREHFDACAPVLREFKKTAQFDF